MSVFGNISNSDVQRTVAALPMLCPSGALEQENEILRRATAYSARDARPQ